MINVDTDRLREMVRILDNANHKIDEATNVLMQITTHNDWGCAERHQINDYIMQSRKTIQQLQGKSDQFYNAMDQLAGQFVETENNIGSMFQNLEAVISKILQANVISITGNVLPEITVIGSSTIGPEWWLEEMHDILPIMPPQISVSEIWDNIPHDIINIYEIIESIKVLYENVHTGFPVPDNWNIAEIISRISLDQLIM